VVYFLFSTAMSQAVGNLPFNNKVVFMKIFNSITLASLLVFSSASMAQLQPYKDFDFGEKVIAMTTVRVKANMMGDYLEGLRDTWIQSNQVAKELNQLEDYAVYQSQLPQSGDFNLILVITYKNAADLEPNKAAYDKFMKAWGDKMQEKSRKISANYPDMRTITGQYRLRKIEMK
jgi:hypothetical protein